MSELETKICTVTTEVVEKNNQISFEKGKRLKTPTTITIINIQGGT